MKSSNTLHLASLRDLGTYHIGGKLCISNTQRIKVEKESVQTPLDTLAMGAQRRDFAYMQYEITHLYFEWNNFAPIQDFSPGGGGVCGPYPTDRKSPANVFVLCCFFSSHFILQRGLMVYFKDHYSSSRFQGFQHFPRDSIFSGGCGGTIANSYGNV